MSKIPDGNYLIIDNDIDMKTYKFFRLLAIAFVLLVVGCQPMEDRDDLTNSTTIEGVELVATQSTLAVI